MSGETAWRESFELLKTCRRLFPEESALRAYELTCEHGLLDREEMNLVLRYMPLMGAGRSWLECEQLWDWAYEQAEQCV